MIVKDVNILNVSFKEINMLVNIVFLILIKRNKIIEFVFWGR